MILYNTEMLEINGKMATILYERHNRSSHRKYDITYTCLNMYKEIKINIGSYTTRKCWTLIKMASILYE